MKLSICIPTFNRASHLRNCLNSIAASGHVGRSDVEICVSDNGSTDTTRHVVEEAQKKMPVRFSRNEHNLGIPLNFLKVVEMATGDFVWLLGDDDLLVPSALARMIELIDAHPKVEFFYINSFHLTSKYVLAFPQPFDTVMLPEKMKPFSTWRHDKELPFFSLIDPRISFDFLGGMFLAVFRRDKWLANVTVLDSKAIVDVHTFSNFDNTFPHVKIFASAFRNSLAYVHSQPLSVCLSGAREWAPMYPLVRSVRLIEALEEYRRQGLPLLRYLWCRNYALHYFIPDMGYILLRGERTGRQYLQPFKLFLANILYPNCLFSFVLYFVGKLKRLLYNWYRLLTQSS
jgi:glycosyltransferase involved in cell wall biosynthesis